MTSYRIRTRHDPAVVLEKVREFIAGRHDKPFFQSVAAGEIARQLDGRTDPWDKATAGQVVRALEKLVFAGELVKTGRGDRGPDGRVHNPRQPLYWTPDAYTAAEATAADRDARAVTMLARRARIYDELASRGIYPETARSGDIRLSTASWFRLLGLDEDRESPAGQPEVSSVAAVKAT